VTNGYSFDRTCGGSVHERSMLSNLGNNHPVIYCAADAS